MGVSLKEVKWAGEGSVHPGKWVSFPGIFGGVESDGRYLSHQNFGGLSICLLEGLQGTH